MTERDDQRENDVREVLDNPEWSEADIRAGYSLSDFAPAMAESIAHMLGRPVRRSKRLGSTETSEPQDAVSS